MTLLTLLQSGGNPPPPPVRRGGVSYGFEKRFSTRRKHRVFVKLPNGDYMPVSSPIEGAALAERFAREAAQARADERPAPEVSSGPPALQQMAVRAAHAELTDNGRADAWVDWQRYERRIREIAQALMDDSRHRVAVEAWQAVQARLQWQRQMDDIAIVLLMTA